MPLQVEPGDPITYTVQLTHLHPFAVAHNVILTDTLPVETTFIRATPPYSLFDRTLQWDLGDMAPNASQSLQIVVQTPEDFIGPLIDNPYGARSTEVPFSFGPPITGLVGWYFYYFSHLWK